MGLDRVQGVLGLLPVPRQLPGLSLWDEGHYGVKVLHAGVGSPEGPQEQGAAPLNTQRCLQSTFIHN